MMAETNKDRDHQTPPCTDTRPGNSPTLVSIVYKEDCDGSNPAFTDHWSAGAHPAGVDNKESSETGDSWKPVVEVEEEYWGQFCDKVIRRGFIRKVYLILTAQLLVTVAFIALFIFVKPVKEWVQNDGLWFYIVAYVLFLVLYMVLICCKSVRRNYPGNFICLAIFTMAFSYMTATISSFHDTEIVLLAAGMTAAVCISISIFAIQTKIDFTICYGFLFGLVMVFFFFSMACIVIHFTWGNSHILKTIYAGLGALVFAMFLIYDTQDIMRGGKHKLSPEEYIYGALQLYIDVVYIFLYLLALFGKSK